VLFKLIKEKVW